MNAIPQIARCMIYQEPPPLSGWVTTRIECHGDNLLVETGANYRIALLIKWDEEKEAP